MRPSARSFRPPRNQEALVSFDTTPNFRLFDRGWAKALPHTEALKWLEEHNNDLPVTVTVRPQLRHAVERPLCQPMEAPGVSVPLPSLGKELGSLLASGRGADVTLLCHGESVPAHRLLLSLRSPVFAALLDDESPLRCRDLSAVPVPDEVQPEALRALCEFLYTDEEPELSTSEEARARWFPRSPWRSRDTMLRKAERHPAPLAAV